MTLSVLSKVRPIGSLFPSRVLLWGSSDKSELQSYLRWNSHEWYNWKRNSKAALRLVFLPWTVIRIWPMRSLNQIFRPKAAFCLLWRPLCIYGATSSEPLISDRALCVCMSRFGSLNVRWFDALTSRHRPACRRKQNKKKTPRKQNPESPEIIKVTRLFRED